jgi:hypothetical protein
MRKFLDGAGYVWVCDGPPVECYGYASPVTNYFYRPPNLTLTPCVSTIRLASMLAYLAQGLVTEICTDPDLEMDEGL